MANNGGFAGCGFLLSLFIGGRHADTATGVLIGQVEVASEVTGIQFNPLLKQVATSHHSYFQDVPADSLPVNINIATYCYNVY